MRFAPSVDAVVARFARSYPWIERDELRQEVALALAEIDQRRTWRDGEAAIATYQARAAYFQLLEFARRARSPVHGSASALGRLDLRAVPLGDAERDLPVSTDLDERLDIGRALDLIRGVAALAGPAAHAVIVGEMPPREAARAHRVPVVDVYRQVKNARREILRRARELGMGAR